MQTTDPQPGDRVRVSYETIVGDHGHFLGKGHVQREQAENARVEVIRRYDPILGTALDKVAGTITAARCHDAASAGGYEVAKLADETVRITADVYRAALDATNAERDAQLAAAQTTIREHRTRIDNLAAAVQRYRRERDEARSWARHGYEIGQCSATWSDQGVAPKWLTEGHNPAALVAPEPLPVDQRVSVVENQIGWAFNRLEEVERVLATAAWNRCSTSSPKPPCDRR